MFKGLLLAKCELSCLKSVPIRKFQTICKKEKLNEFNSEIRSP